MLLNDTISERYAILESANNANDEYITNDIRRAA